MLETLKEYVDAFEMPEPVLVEEEETAVGAEAVVDEAAAAEAADVALKRRLNQVSPRMLWKNRNLKRRKSKKSRLSKKQLDEVEEPAEEEAIPDIDDLSKSIFERQAQTIG